MPRDHTLTILAVSLLVTGCPCKAPWEKAPEPPPLDEETVEPKPVGGCNNEHLEGECTFLSMHVIDPEQAGGPEGTSLVRVSHVIEDGDRKVDLDTTVLRIPSDREEDLRKHFEENSPVECTAYIVWPPCNPQATSLTLDLDHPDWATEERY